MQSIDPVVFRELSVIHKIIEDETWLEGERRGSWVSVDDPVVRENVCQVVLRVGEQLREAMRLAIAANPEEFQPPQKRAGRHSRAA